MYRSTPLSLGLALPALFLSTAAWADLTPAQVWGDWRQYMEGMGYEVTVTENQSGDTLSLSDMTVVFPMPEAEGTMQMNIGAIDLTQNGGGSVAVVLPETLPITILTTGTKEGSQVTANLNYRQTGHSMVASGTAEEIAYTYGSDTFGLTLDGLTIDGKSQDETNARLDVSGTDMAGSTKMNVGDMRGYRQTGSIGSLSYDFFVNNPEETGQIRLNGNMSDLVLRSSGMIPLAGVDAADMAAMIKAGFEVAGDITFGSGNSSFEFQDPAEGNFSSATSSDGGALTMAIGPDGMAYSGAQNNLTVKLNVAEMPFPIDLSMAQGGFNLALPITRSDTPDDFAFGVRLGDFVMSDMLWGIFDPTGQLPRDPATVELDLTGKVKLLVDPDSTAELAGPPGEVSALNVNTLVVDAVGARFEGTGSVAFDNTDMTTFPGMPKPVGAINLSLRGGNALLDKLVAMGLLPQDQAMGARMMMGLFAVPGGKPDTLSSKIEFTQDGQMLANGQRIK